MKLKRIIVMLLICAMLFSMVPATVFAEETETSASVDNGNITVEGTNGVGTLLSNELSQYQEEAAAEAQPEEKAAKKYICTVCGYEHEGELPEDFECPLCGGRLIKRTGKFGEFFGCSNYKRTKSSKVQNRS